MLPGLGLIAPPRSRLGMALNPIKDRYRITRNGALVAARLADILTFQRASAATDFDAAGNLAVYPADTIRNGFDPATLTRIGWALEGVATNTIRNSRVEGAVIGSPGNVPPGWGYGTAGGLTREVVGSGVFQGIPYIDIRISGTPTNANLSLNLTLEQSPNAPALTTGQTAWTSAWVSLVAGTLANPFLFTFTELDAARVNLGTYKSTAAFTPNATWRRFAGGVAATNAACAFAVPGLWIGGTVVGVPIDYTLRIGGPQFETNTYCASSLILPPVGSPAATSRAADMASVAGSNFAAIFGAGAPSGVVIADVLVPALHPTNNMFVAALSDGTIANEVRLTVGPNGSTSIGYNLGGSNLGGPGSAGTVTAGNVFRLGGAWDAGKLRACLNGGAISSGVPTGIPATSALRLGCRSDNTFPMAGRIRGVWASANGAVPDAAFRAACTLGADIESILGI